MIENLENIYIYIDDNLNIELNPDFKVMSAWAKNISIAINSDEGISYYKISGDKISCETVNITKLEDIIVRMIKGNNMNSLVISDCDLVDLYEKKKFDNSYEFTDDELGRGIDIGLGIEYYGNAKYVLFEAEDLNEDYLRSVFFRKIGKPLEIFRTERLIIREMCLDDMPAYIKLYDSLKSCDFVEKLYPYDEEVEFVKNYIQNMYTFFGYGLWLVFKKDSNELIGRAGIENREIDGETKQEIGYLIGKAYQGKGYAYEACQGILDYARTVLNFDELFACVHKENFPSIALAEKLGFRIYARDVGEMNIYRIEI